MSVHPALFLDRDGVIIRNRPDYVKSKDEISFYETALRALALLAGSKYKIIVVTNQSAVGRKIISREELDGINRYIQHVVEQKGGRIDGVFVCPHRPEDGCSCRKPRPGLILQAARVHHIDLGKSILIGDAWSDILAGRAAGIPVNVLVLTGRGREQLRLPDTPLPPDKVFEDLLEAAETLLAELGEQPPGAAPSPAI